MAREAGVHTCDECLIKIGHTNAPTVDRLWASLDQGISWTFVGHIHQSVPRCFLEQHFFRLDAQDQEQVKQAVGEVTGHPVEVAQVLPPGFKTEVTDE